MSAFKEARGSWRVALRLARRSARRNPARTVLILLMLALPVYAGSVLALAYAGTYHSPETEAGWVLGRADLRVDGLPAAKLPPGAEYAPVGSGQTVVRSGEQYLLVRYEAADMAAPLNQGRYAPRSGRAPRGAGEVVVTRSLAARLGLRVGARLPVGTPLRDRTVTGIADLATDLHTEAVILPAGAAPSPGARFLLVKAPGGWQPTEPNVSWLARDIDGYRAEQATRAAALVLVLAFAGTQVALLAGAAFAIGAQRRRRELGMAGAVGARRAQVARLVLADGLLLGAGAGLLGTGLGVLTYRLARPTVERVANHPLAGGAGDTPWWLAGIALFAVATGLLAALGPARGAARQAIRTALAGRETPRPGANLRWLTGGLLVAAAGATAATLAAGRVGSALTVAAGTVAVLLGVAACAPTLVALLGRTAGRLPLPLRLAVRHAARHRLRTAASVAAVCAAVAGSTAVMMFASAGSTDDRTLLQVAPAGQVLVPPQAHLDPATLQAVAAELPTRAAIQVSEVDSMTPSARMGPSYDTPTQIAVGGVDLVRAVTGTTPTLDRTRAVVFYPELLQDGHLILNGPTGTPLRLPATFIPAPDHYRYLPGAVIPPPLAARHALKTHPAGAVIDTTRPPTPAEAAAAESRMLAATATATAAAAAAVDGGADGVGAGDELVGLIVAARPAPDGRDFSAMFYVLAAVSTLVTLAAGTVAVGLTTSELRPDLGTLAAVGAAPRLRRRIAAAQAGLIVGLGALLGTVGGIAPAAGLVAFRDDLRWSIPWIPLLATVVLAPGLAIAGTALLTRPRLILIRRPT